MLSAREHRKMAKRGSERMALRVASCASAPLGSKADAIRAIRCKQVE
jgi:hypothetical protein